MNKNKEKDVDGLLKAFWISLSLFIVFLIILFLGFLPNKEIKNTFLIASVIYFAFAMFWVVSRFDSFKLLRNIRKTILKTIRSKETRKYYDEKELVKSSNIGLYITISISTLLLIISIVIDVSI